MKHWSKNRFHYGTEKVIAQLRALPDDGGDRSRADHRDEIVATWDRCRADRDAAAVVSDETAASDHYRAVGDEHDAFGLRLVHLRTADPDVMRIKAAAVLNIWSGNPDRFDHAVDRVVEAKGDSKYALYFSLMRDVMHVLGAAYRVTA